MAGIRMPGGGFEGIVAAEALAQQLRDNFTFYKIDAMTQHRPAAERIHDTYSKANHA